MNALLSSLLSDLETKDKEENSTKWLKRKLNISRRSTRPLISMGKVLAEARLVRWLGA